MSTRLSVVEGYCPSPDGKTGSWANRKEVLDKPLRWGNKEQRFEQRIGDVKVQKTRTIDALRRMFAHGLNGGVLTAIYEGMNGTGIRLEPDADVSVSPFIRSEDNRDELQKIVDDVFGKKEDGRVLLEQGEMQKPPENFTDDGRPILSDHAVKVIMTRAQLIHAVNAKAMAIDKNDVLLPLRLRDRDLLAVNKDGKNIGEMLEAAAQEMRVPLIVDVEHAYYMPRGIYSSDRDPKKTVPISESVREKLSGKYRKPLPPSLVDALYCKDGLTHLQRISPEEIKDLKDGDICVVVADAREYPHRTKTPLALDTHCPAEITCVEAGMVASKYKVLKLLGELPAFLGSCSKIILPVGTFFNPVPRKEIESADNRLFDAVIDRDSPIIGVEGGRFTLAVSHRPDIGPLDPQRIFGGRLIKSPQDLISKPFDSDNNQSTSIFKVS